MPLRDEDQLNLNGELNCGSIWAGIRECAFQLPRNGWGIPETPSILYARLHAGVGNLFSPPEAPVEENGIRG